jgi:CheY-like chemotaxis protein
LAMKKILIVDDENNFLLSLKDGLSDTFSILCANNGQEALDILAGEEVNLVITDIKMPVMDGFELLAQMNNAYSDIPVIVMTAFGSSEMEERLDAMGAFQYVEKPIDFDILINRVNQGLAAAKKGNITGVSLSSFMQLLSLDKKTCTLRITSGDHIGTIFFSAGELLQAFTESLQGVDAALEIASWDPVDIELQHLCRQREQVIDAPLGYILIESARRKDEKAEEEAKNKAKGDGESSCAGQPQEIDPASLIQPPEDPSTLLGQEEVDAENKAKGDGESSCAGQPQEIDPASLIQPPEDPSTLLAQEEVDADELVFAVEEAAAPSLPVQVSMLLDIINPVDGVNEVVVFDKKNGSIVAERNQGGNLSPYCAALVTQVTQINSELHLTVPRTFILHAQTGSTVLIVNGPQVFVALGLANTASADAVAGSIRPVVQRLTL